MRIFYLSKLVVGQYLLPLTYSIVRGEEELRYNTKIFNCHNMAVAQSRESGEARQNINHVRDDLRKSDGGTIDRHEKS